jgi:hypothetical protein
VARPSLLRGVVGWTSLLLSLILLVMSAVMLVRALEVQGDGSPDMRGALVWMGTAGALMANGIALLIWEYSVRHHIPH